MKWNGVEMTCRAASSLPLIKLNTFDRLVLNEAKTIVENAIKNGSVGFQVYGCPRCKGTTHAEDKFCDKCRSQIIIKACKKRNNDLLPTIQKQCKCGKTFETKKPNQIWCEIKCLKKTQSKNKQIWGQPKPCLTCKTVFTPARPWAKNCKRCNRYIDKETYNK